LKHEKKSDTIVHVMNDGNFLVLHSDKYCTVIIEGRYPFLYVSHKMDEWPKYVKKVVHI